MRTREFVIQGTQDEVDKAKLQLTKSLEGGYQLYLIYSFEIVIGMIEKYIFD